MTIEKLAGGYLVTIAPSFSHFQGVAQLGSVPAEKRVFATLVDLVVFLTDYYK